MSEAPSNHELARLVAVLEERMKTHEASMESHQTTYELKLAEFGKQLAERDSRNTRWIMAWNIALAGIIIALMFNLLERLPSETAPEATQTAAAGAP